MFRTQRVPYERVLDDKGIRKGGILKAWEHALLLKDKPSGKKTGLTFAGTWDKIVYDLWKKGQETQEKYKGIVRMCREKIRGKSSARNQPGHCCEK